MRPGASLEELRRSLIGRSVRGSRLKRGSAYLSDKLDWPKEVPRPRLRPAPSLLCYTSPMEIDVELRRRDKVTSPGTEFMAAYRRAWDCPSLRLTRSWIDPACPGFNEFRAAAFQAAVSKARAGVDCVVKAEAPGTVAGASQRESTLSYRPHPLIGRIDAWGLGRYERGSSNCEKPGRGGR